MTALPDREQLKRDCSDALEAHLREQRVDGLAELAESFRTLGPPYRFHGELMHGALRDGQENAITWHLIHVLEKLEAGARMRKEKTMEEQAHDEALEAPDHANCRARTHR